MKRVAIIGAEFSPSSLPPALRLRFFVQHLDEFGWEPIVITTEAKYYESPFDAENDCLLPSSLQVIRTAAVSSKVSRKVGIGDIALRSLWHHWRALKALCRDRHIDLVFIPVPPSFSMLLARLVYHRFRIPCVVDYQDPWVTKEWRRMPRRQRPPKRALVHTLSCILEPIALKYVTQIVGVSKATTDSVIARYHWLTETDATEIPCAAEPDDFDYVRSNPRRHGLFDVSDGFLHVSYVGIVNWNMLPALRAVFQAIKLGVLRSPRIFCQLRVHFVGTTYAPDAHYTYQVMPLAQELGVDDLIDEHPARVSYLDALQILLDSHALFIVGSDAPHYTASKVFPCIWANRPILAVFHEKSSVVRILRETQRGEVFTFSEECSPTSQVDEISKAIERILLASRNEGALARKEVLECYTARAMTGLLAQVFDRATRGCV